MARRGRHGYQYSGRPRCRRVDGPGEREQAEDEAEAGQEASHKEGEGRGAAVAVAARGSSWGRSGSRRRKELGRGRRDRFPWPVVRHRVDRRASVLPVEPATRQPVRGGALEVPCLAARLKASAGFERTTELAVPGKAVQSRQDFGEARGASDRRCLLGVPETGAPAPHCRGHGNGHGAPTSLRTPASVAQLHVVRQGPSAPECPKASVPAARSQGRCASIATRSRPECIPGHLRGGHRPGRRVLHSALRVRGADDRRPLCLSAGSSREPADAGGALTPGRS
jgi:hypothetical protein